MAQSYLHKFLEPSGLVIYSVKFHGTSLFLPCWIDDCRGQTDDNHSNEKKKGKYPEKSRGKCVSEAWLCDPKELRRKQNAAPKDGSTHQQHKCMTNIRNPELSASFHWCKYPLNHLPKSIMCHSHWWTALQLVLKLHTLTKHFSHFSGSLHTKLKIFSAQC